MGMNALSQTPVAHFDMSLKNGKIVEAITNNSYSVNSQLPACTVEGLEGEALRFDGYSNYVKAGLPISTLSSEALTVNVTLAPESYPMMQTDAAETTLTYATICGNVDQIAKKGFALQLSSQGDLRLVVGVAYGTGYLITVDGSEKLPRGKWNKLSLVYDKSGNAVTLYLNGNNIGSKKVNKCALMHSDGDFWIGKDATEIKDNMFLLNAFCGAIDDIAIYNSLITPSSYIPEYADLAYPAERYAGSLWRPQFHCMPSGSWTNESHGMIYSNGLYHVFSQKNPNGPYMSRLHWGHYSSANLYDWKEENIAVYPSESFDLKGCWSGCVYEDGGTPYIIYTAVDNSKARIAQVKADDATLTEWTDKKVIIDGRPSGLSDDFRDPYYFEANGEKYIIVGTSKGGLGACTLHQLKNGAWTNDGSIFYQSTNASQYGTFWEMPNVTPMGDGKWLFTCTPIGLGTGTRALCWIGTIGTDGKFTPTSDMQPLEMGGISKDGYGLLSPTIYQKDGRTLLLGIVPDKISTSDNANMGWAHTFSLPREISLAADGSLVQKPCSELSAMRTTTFYEKELSLMGTESVAPVSGLQIELLAEFTVGTSGECGFQFLKSGDKQATLTYNVATGQLSLNTTALSRVATDDGVWSATLPQKVGEGQRLKLHLFLDGSIVDIFVNDRWAFSSRIFSNDAAQVEAEVMSTVTMPATVKAWTLDAKQSATGISAISSEKRQTETTIHDLSGRCLSGRCLSGALHKGFYIVNGRKYLVK